MLLRVLGSGTCELRQERSAPAYLVEAGAAALMLDLGQGAWRRLLEAGRDPAGLSGVLISHPHPDHVSDLVPLLFALNYAPHMAAARLALLAHPGLARVLQGLTAAFGPWLEPPERALERRWLAPGQETSLGGVRILAAAAAHHPHSLAFRLEHEGAVLVYLGDSEASPSLARFASGAGLLICHCAGSDQRPRPGHLHPAACGRLAAAAGARALLLSHFYRDVDPEQAAASAAEHFSGAVWAASDHLELVLGPGSMDQAESCAT
ncbi:MAG: ribonuclease Z [Desulfarculus sp.]|nr:MAG: ribonuclease Z [Desulfarculus sp.]